MDGSGIAALSILVPATLYCFVQLAGFAASLDGGIRVRRLRAARLLRASVLWELAVGVDLVVLGSPQGAISVFGVASMIAFTQWAMRRFPI